MNLTTTLSFILALGALLAPINNYAEAQPIDQTVLQPVHVACNEDGDFNF